MTLLELQAFTAGDCQQLIGWVPDARFLLQWAGPRYTFPLDEAQLRGTLGLAEGDKPSYYVFKAVRLPERDVIGHVQLMNIGYDRSTCVLGRVLIADPELRRKGYGTQLVRLAVEFAFDELGLDEIRLSVFDLNQAAVRCYERLGFTQSEFREGARQFGDDAWNLIVMRLRKPEWLNRHGDARNGEKR